MSNKLVNTVIATIANGASLSDAIDMLGMDFLAIRMPAAWTAAVMTLQASEDGSNYANVFTDAGVEKTFTVDATEFIVITSSSFFNPIRYLKFRSGTAGVPVNQGAQRLLTIIRRPF